MTRFRGKTYRYPVCTYYYLLIISFVDQERDGCCYGVFDSCSTLEASNQMNHLQSVRLFVPRVIYLLLTGVLGKCIGQWLDGIRRPGLKPEQQDIYGRRWRIATHTRR
jgi:hypothetical protein